MLLVRALGLCCGWPKNLSRKPFWQGRKTSIDPSTGSNHLRLHHIHLHDLIKDPKAFARLAFQAIQAGDAKSLLTFLAEGLDPNLVLANDDREEGWTLLHEAVGCRSSTAELTPETCAACVETLIRAGADVNATSQSSKVTPLMLAVANSLTICVSFLLEHGADTQRIDSQGRTAMDYLHNNIDMYDPLNEVKQLLSYPPTRVNRSPTNLKAKMHGVADMRTYEVELSWKMPRERLVEMGNSAQVLRYVVYTVKDEFETMVLVKRSGECGSGQRNSEDDPWHRGSLLRHKLRLPSSESTSTIIKGLLPGHSYSFSVTCEIEVDGRIVKSRPSIPTPEIVLCDDTHRWSWMTSSVATLCSPVDNALRRSRIQKSPSSKVGLSDFDELMRKKKRRPVLELHDSDIDAKKLDDDWQAYTQRSRSRASLDSLELESLGDIAPTSPGMNDIKLDGTSGYVVFSLGCPNRSPNVC